MNIHKEILAAETRIRQYVRETPLEYSPVLSRAGDCDVYLKLECFQKTGSFKYRGAANKFLSLDPEKRKEEMITASSGNHGAAFASLMKDFGGKGTIYLPAGAFPAKVEFLRQHGVGLEFIGDDCLVTESAAKEAALEKKLTFVSPYNDPQIIGGQGTIGVELAKQLKDIDVVLVPVGGGGLISGIAVYLKSVRNQILIIGCQPEASPVMAESVKAGRIIEMESAPTLADGTAGGIEPYAITFDICRQVVDDFSLVSENEIRSAIRLMIEQHQILIEGAAALPVASFLKEKDRFTGKSVVLVISGRKISLDKLKQVLA